jgi:hypothetical protein
VVYAILALPASLYANSFSQYAKSVFYPLAVLLAFRRAPTGRQWMGVLVSAMAVSAALMAGLMYFQVGYREFDFSLQYLLSKERWPGHYFMNPLVRVGPTTASSCIGLTVVVLATALVSGNRRNTGLLAAGIVVGLVFMALSGGRGAMVAGVLTVALVVSRRSGHGLTRSSAGLLAGGLLAAVALGFVTSLLVMYLPTSQLERLDIFVSGRAGDSLAGRFWLWEQAVHAAQSGPLGRGFDYFHDTYGRTTHNELLGQMVAAGWAAAAAYVVLLVIVCLRGWRLLLVAGARGQWAVSAACSSAFFLVTLLSMETHSKSSANITYPLLWACIGVLDRHYEILRHPRGVRARPTGVTSNGTTEGTVAPLKPT